MGDLSREPSMEEILSSIRRVIARDEAARDAALAARSAGAPADTPPPGDAAADALTDVGPQDASDEDVLELTEMEDAGQADTNDPATGALPAGTAATASAEELVSGQTVAASRAALSELSRAVAPPQGTECPAAASPGTTIEAIAEAAMRPMLKAWLDEHLPPMVERMVAQEIARITGARR